MLKGGGDFHHPVDVHPALVSEGAAPHIGKPWIGDHVRHLRHRPDGVSQVPKALLRNASIPPFQLQRRQDGRKVCVPAPLAEAQKGALDLLDPRLDRHQAVGHGAAGVVVAVNSQRRGSFPLQAVHNVEYFVRKRPAVGVAKHQCGCPRRFRRFQDCFRIVRIVLPSVEEMLGIENDLPTSFR